MQDRECVRVRVCASKSKSAFSFFLILFLSHTLAISLCPAKKLHITAFYMQNWSMTPAAKYSLTIKEKKKFEIPSQSESYIFLWDKVLEEQCKDMDKFVEADGFKIVDKNLESTATDMCDYSVIAYRPLK